MELHSANLSLQSNSSLEVPLNSQRLDSQRALSAQTVRSNVQVLEGADKQQRSRISDVSTVVSKLIIGSQASAAAYSELVTSTSAASQSSSAIMAVNQSNRNNQTTLSVNDAQAQSSEKLTKKIEQENAELSVVRKLSSIDRKVKAHEQTHASIGGPYAGAPSFNFTSGPDGQLYATSGEVSIDTSPVENDPRATLEKAQVIIRAALSVTDPSPADRQIAAEAKSLALKAMSQIGEQGENLGAGQQSSKAGEVQAQVEQQQLEREEYLAEQELKKAREDRNDALRQARSASNDASIEVLREYNVQISEIQDTLRRLNVQLVDSGAFEKVFPEGALIDQNV